MESKLRFNVFRYWYRIQCEVCKHVVPSYEAISNAQKVSFTKRIFVFKDATGFSDDHVKGLMLFTVTHDPLGEGRFSELEYHFRTSPHFRLFLLNKRMDIESFGLTKAIVINGPSTLGGSTAQADIDIDLEEFDVAFRKAVNTKSNKPTK